MNQQENMQQEESLRERSMRERKEREKGKKRILMNMAIALGIILVALIAKAVMPEPKQAPKSSPTNKKEIVESTLALTVEPTITPAPKIGAQQWLRKDLDPSKPMIAFTFDDGPYTKVTKRILNALKKVNGRATFFVVGNRVATYSDTLKLAYDMGNQIGSHTYDHKDLSKMKAKKIKWEINKTNREVNKIIGCNTTALRPPYGNVSKTMRKCINTSMYYWSVDSEDWKSRNADKVVKRCKQVKDGDIILMHDLYTSTAEATERLLPYLTKKGFQLVTIDELFYYKNIQTGAGKVYFAGR